MENFLDLEANHIRQARTLKPFYSYGLFQTSFNKAIFAH